MASLHRDRMMPNGGNDGAGPGTMTVVPASEAAWEDLQLIFGTRGDAHRCQCQWFKLPASEWQENLVEQRALQLQEQTGCGDRAAAATSGLVAYLDGQPVGWCAVEPRTAYPRLLGSRVVWAGRNEDKQDDGVWALTCFTTRTGYRRRGVSRALAWAAVDFAHSRGADALEGYPMLTEPGRDVALGELFVGTRGIFDDAGFVQVSHPTPRRVVMRIDFTPS